MSDRTPNLDSLFEAAAELKSADERAAFLEQACGTDIELRRQIEQLLVADEKRGNILEKPPAELGDAIAQSDSDEDQAASLKAGLASEFGKDESLVIGSANHSVLGSFENTLDLPRVILRKPNDEPDSRIQCLNSPDIPDADANRRYQMQGEIARGGMGAIIKGRDTDLGRDLAIKVLLDEHKTRPDVIQRFLEEAQIGGQLQHPGIVPIYELGQFADARPYFSMKLVKGETLSKLLADREDAAKDRGKFVGIFEQICQTMAYAHSRGVIHRDLKPANIMIGAFGEVQVMDWGLAKVLQVGGVADEKKDRDTQHAKSIIQTLRSVGSDTPASLASAGSETQMGSVIGTPAYMPPEQALGEIDRLNERSDVFGLGAILCQILTGQPPYVGADGKQIFRLASRGKLNDCFARLDACDADADLIQIAKACLALEPEDRPRDAGILTEQLSGYLESVETKLRDTELERAAQAARTIEERKRLKVTLALAASILFTLLAGGSGWMWIRSQQAQRLAAAATDINVVRAQARLHRQLAANIESELDADPQQLLDAAKLNRWLAEINSAVDKAQEAVELAEEENVDQDLLDSVSKFRTELQEHSDPVRLRIAQIKEDIGFQKSLNQIRLSQADVDSNSSMVEMPNDQIDEAGSWDSDSSYMFSLGSSPQEYEQAFADARLDLVELDVPQAAAIIRDSPIREDILGALDNWARMLPTGTSSSASKAITRERLVAVADRADPSLWRKSLRSELLTGDARKLIELATAPEAGRQSATLIVWLSAALREKGEYETVIGLLEAALQKDPGDFWLNYELARSFSDQGEHGNAITFARTTLAIRPDSPGARCMLGRTLGLGNNYPQAVSVLRTAAAIFPTDPAISTHLAWAFTQSRDFENAVAECYRGLEHNPENSYAYNNLGWALFHQGKLDESIAMNKKAIEIDPRNANAYVALAEGLNKKSKPDEAIAMYRKAVELDPGNADAHIDLAWLLYEQGKLDEAIAVYREAIESNPESSILHNNLGYSLSQHGGKRNEIIAEYRKAIELDLSNAGPLNNLASFLPPEERIVLYRNAIRHNPRYAQFYRSLGTLLNEQGELGEAIVMCRKAIEIDPRDTLAYVTLADGLNKQGKPDDAIAVYRKAIERNPIMGGGRLHSDLAWMLKRQGKFDDAIPLYRKAIELGPSDTRFYGYLAMALKENGKPDEAIAMYRKAIVSNPKLYINLGDFFNQQGKPEDAITEFRKAIEIIPNYHLAYDRLASAFQTQGKPDEAIAMYRKAIELNPKYAYAYSQLAGLLNKEGKPDEAIAKYRECIEFNPNDSLAHNNLAWALVVSANTSPEDAREGVGFAERACALQRSDVNANTLGVAYYRDQQWPNAIEALQQSVDLGSDDPYNWLFIAMSHWQLGEKGEAQKWYAKSVAWREKNKPTPELQGFFAEAEKLLGEAPETKAKPNKTPSSEQKPSPEKTPPANGAQDQPPGKQNPQDQTTDSDNSTRNGS